MPILSFRERWRNGWNAFRSRDPTEEYNYLTEADIKEFGYGHSSATRPDRHRLLGGVERSIINGMYSRLAVDVSAIRMEHCQTDDNGKYIAPIDSGLNDRLTIDANIDQTSRELVRDIVLSLCDEGVVAVVPVDTDVNPRDGTYEIRSLRTGRIIQWRPTRVEIDIYNDRTGVHQQIWMDKADVAIIENPLYSIMNEYNSTLRRLITKLNILDVIDDQSGSGKLDILVQLPFPIRTEARKTQAENRKQALEDQLRNSKYGIGYIDATERITQLNRPAGNNLMEQVQTLTRMLYGQLGLSEAVFLGTADEREMLNYWSRTIEPFLSAIRDEYRRKFISASARASRQTIMFFKGAFLLAPAEQLAELADKLTRNEILSPNEVRQEIGYKPSSDVKADELRNRNLNPGAGQTGALTPDDGQDGTSAGVKKASVNTQKGDPANG